MSFTWLVLSGLDNLGLAFRKYYVIIKMHITRTLQIKCLYIFLESKSDVQTRVPGRSDHARAFMSCNFLAILHLGPCRFDNNN
jgi:hypothetical protein